MEIAGLKPDRVYWYRFRQGGWLSPVGRARTLPPPGATDVPPLRFAFVSCQDYEVGYYAAYRHLAADDPALVLHLGDYIYESAVDASSLRPHAGGETRTLADYRQRYAQYRSDPDLQRAHATCAWMVIGDDHEVVNDYAGEHSPTGDPAEQFLLRRAAAYQAYWEHMPLRLSARPDGPSMLLYRSLQYGDLLNLQLLDGRQYRSDQPCPLPGKLGGQVVQSCPARLSPEQTLLGPAQERWLLQRLQNSSARWNLIGQQMMMAQLDQDPGPGTGWWTDGWEGYAAARARILQHLASRRVSNPVVLGGDIHSFWATDLKLDFDDPASPTVASEFVGTSISSTGVKYEAFKAMADASPHIRFFDSRRRGYARGRLSRDRLDVDFVAVDDATRRDSGAAVLASWAVEAGRPGPQRA